MAQKYKNELEQIQRAARIDDICASLEKCLNCNIFFDSSRAWSLYTLQKPVNNIPDCGKYGAYRSYLGGGIRGPIKTNLPGELGELFITALRNIEDLINQENPDCEEWEKQTGVLL